MINSSEETQKLAESVENNAGVYLVPAFAGLSAPYWSSDARAAIVGMTAHATRAHVVRAALESIAYQVRDVLGMMSEQTGVATRLIHADGGATSNGFLMQFTADIINAEVRTSMVAESSPLGAVMCGAVGSRSPVDRTTGFTRQGSNVTNGKCHQKPPTPVTRVGSKL